MLKSSLLLIILSVCMSAVAQVLLKSGMSASGVQRALAEGLLPKTALTILTNGGVLLGLLVYFASAIVWLGVLSRVDVSVAYPFVALGFVLTAVLGQQLLGETLTIQRIAGILLVCAGVTVLARG